MKSSASAALAFTLGMLLFLAPYHALYKVAFAVLLYFFGLYGICYIFKKAFPPRLSFTACMVASIVAFYFFSTVTSIRTEPLLCKSCIAGDHYCNLAVSFLSGKRGVIEIPQGAADQAAWWDLSLYKQKLYAYWGITPALFLFMPAKLLTGYTPHQALCLALFVSMGYIFSLYVFALLLKKSGLEDSTPPLYWHLCVACLGLCTLYPFLLRSPKIYEIAIASGYCFSMASLAFLLRARESEGGRRNNLFLFSSGLACALAVGCRPVTAVVTGFALLYFACRLYSSRSLRSIGPGVASYFAPYVSYGAFLGLYNYARFDSFLEFGVHYQLNQFNMQALGGTFSNLMAGATSFLFTRPVYFPCFPYFFLTRNNIFGLPHTFVDELVVGVFWAIPFIAALAMLPYFLRNGAIRGYVRLFVLLMTGAAAALLAAVSMVGRTARYECEFTVYLIIPALLIFLDMRRRLSGFKRHLFSAAACALIAYSIVFNLCVSFTGYADWFQKSRPDLYDALARIL